MNSKTALTVARVYELFDVDLIAGTFHHKWSVGRAKRGSRAGYVSKPSGYRILCIDRHDYFEHNLVWFLAKGEWLPINGFEVDHINRTRHDNRPENLRKATRSQNTANGKLRKDNIAGHRGVHFDKEKKKYAVQVTANGKTHSLGYFSDVEKAAEAARNMRKKFFGDFAS